MASVVSVKKVTVTKTSTVFLDPASGRVTPDDAAQGPESAATSILVSPPQAVTVVYVTKTRDPATATSASPTPCSNYVCPGDCDDWSCYEANFTAKTSTDTGSRNGEGASQEACDGFVQCIKYKCSHGEPFSYDLSLLWRDTCGQVLPAERVRPYPKPLPSPASVLPFTTKRTTTTTTTATITSSSASTSSGTTSLSLSLPSTLIPSATSPASQTSSGLGPAVIVPIVIAVIVTLLAVIIGAVLACRKWKAKVYRTAAAMANGKELPPDMAPISPDMAGGSFGDYVNGSSVVMPNVHAPSYRSGSPITYSPREFTARDIQSAMERDPATPASRRSRSRSRAPSIGASSKRNSVAGSIYSDSYAAGANNHLLAMTYEVSRMPHDAYADRPSSYSRSNSQTRIAEDGRRSRHSSRGPSSAHSSHGQFGADHPSSPASSRVGSVDMHYGSNEMSYTSPRAGAEGYLSPHSGHATPTSARSRSREVYKPAVPEGYMPPRAYDFRATQLNAEAQRTYYVSSSGYGSPSGYASPRVASPRPDRERRGRDRKRRSRADLVATEDLIGSYQVPLSGRETGQEDL